MIAKLLATEVSTEEADGAVHAALRCQEPHQYLMFERSGTIGDSEDWGIYFEYKDQINSGYNKIKRCTLRRDRLDVQLIGPIDRRKQYDAFEVELRIGRPEWESFALGLRRIFTGHEDILDIG